MNEPPDPPSPEKQLDVLISFYDGLAKNQDMRIHRTDTASASLMTASVALGAGVVAAANGLTNVDSAEKVATYVAVVALVAALLLGGAPRSGRLIRLSRRRRKKLAAWNKKKSASRDKLDQIAGGGDGEAQAEAHIEAQQAVVRYLAARAEIGRIRAEWNYSLLAVGGACLATALAALVVLAFLLLADL